MPRYRSVLYFGAFYAYVVSMDSLSVAGAAACFQQSKPSAAVRLLVTDEEIFNQSVIKCVDGGGLR